MDDQGFNPAPFEDEYYDSFESENNYAEIEEARQLFDPEAFVPGNFENVTKDSIEKAWYAVASAALTTDAPVKRAQQLLSQLQGASMIYEALDTGTKYNTKSLLDALDHAIAVIGDIEYGTVDMHQLGLLERLRISANALGCLERISKTAPASNPDDQLATAINDARRYRTFGRSASLSALITDGSTPSALRDAYKAVVSSPPVALDEGGLQATNSTVGDLFDEKASRESSGSTGIALSSGFPSLDMTLTTRDGQKPGYVRSGQVVVFVAPSGSGKTSAFNTIVPAGVIDAKRQGHLGRTLYCHVEDDTIDIFDSMGIAPGRRYQSIQDSIVTVKTTSREELVKAFYREVLDAKRHSARTGLPVSLYIPSAVFVDYFQALTSEKDGGSEVTSASATADLLLFGFANCDPDAIRKYGGVGFEEYTGESWPEGLDGAEVCVVTTAQLLLKGSSAQTPFDPENDDWRNYATADSTDNPAWDLRPGDLPMAKLDDIRGSSKIVQHATTIIGLHRSRPRNNPGSERTECGRFKSLVDTRGFFTILKARFGQRQVVVPMEFNLQRNGGSKAQYIDSLAEQLLPTGAIPHDEEVFQQSGDPIIPERHMASAMTKVSYL